MSKYHSIRTNGFASAKEARRYQELRLLEKAGKIRNLITQHTFHIKIHDIDVCKYVADFTYYEGDEYVVEDTKGFKTDVYKLKKKLMRAVMGIEVRET